MKKSGIYEIKCLASGKVYIGQTVDLNRRLKDHLRCLRKGTHHNKYLQRAFDKYGEEYFTFSVLQNCTASELDACEQWWIQQRCSMDRKAGYNLESGGNPGKFVSEETRAKKIGKNNPQYGKHLSEAHIDALRVKNRGHNSNLCEKDVEEIKLALLSGKKPGELSSMYGLSSAAIQSISTGKNWGYVRPDLTAKLASRKTERDAAINRLSEEGKSRASIAAIVGCTPATVSRVLGTRSSYFVSSDKKKALKNAVEHDFISGLTRAEIIEKHGISPSVYVSYISEAYNRKREELKARAEKLRKSGMLVKDIAAELGLSKTTISRWTAKTNSRKHRGNQEN